MDAFGRRVLPIHPDASVHLDAVRGVAALVVVLGHVGDLFLPAWSNIPVTSRTPLVRAIYGSTGLAHQAVMLFFVLSGCLVGAEVVRARDSWSWSRYLTARLTRLWLVLIPALVLTMVLDSAGGWLSSGAQPSGHLDWSAGTFVGNVLFLQTVLVPTFGSNGSLWSLSNEFWYYLLFPLFLVGLAQQSWSRRTLHGVALVALAVLLPRGFAGGFVIWMFGAAARINWLRVGPSRAVLVAARYGAVLLLLIVFALIERGQLNGRLSDFVLGAAFACWLQVELLLPAAATASGVYSRGARWLASFSFSLYAVHFPLLVLISGATAGVVFTPGAAGVLSVAALLAVCIAAGAGFGALTERHTRAVRDWASRFTTPVRAAALARQG